MSIGSSGRVVIEIEPEMKQALHTALKNNGSNLKEWFVQQAEEFLRENGRQQLRLDLSASSADRGAG